MEYLLLYKIAEISGGNIIWNFYAKNNSVDIGWVGEIGLDFPDEVDINKVSAFIGVLGDNMEIESEWELIK
ncbi:MAG: hypothetical protein P9X26_09900 [Candidatus Stygibacter frigidus]|nr:hypothetical protein [Candidatus Stygibacter frigidus]